MLRICLALLAGAYALYGCASLPQAHWLPPVSTLAAAGVVFRRTRTAAFALAGFCIAWQAAAAVLADRLPAEREGATLTVTGVVAGFPEQRGDSWRFVLDTRGAHELPARVRLSWYDSDTAPRLGETWRLQVRMRRPRGFANPTGFDYEAWLFRQGIGATGYVLPGTENHRLDVPVALRARLRRHVAERIVAVTGDDDASAVLEAITVGARRRITQRQWDRYAATGTSHLMAISGLHVGLATFGAWCFFRVLLSPFCRWCNLRDAAAVAAVPVAAAYASLSGFAVPAQRAMLMAALVVACTVMRREVRPAQVLATAAVVVFTVDPAAILAPGFKLSFAAVAILLWWFLRRPAGIAWMPDNAGRRLVGTAWRLPPLQLALLFGLLPLTATLFGRVAWFAPLVNLLVLPVFNGLAVPAALAGAVLDGPFRAAGDASLRLSWHALRAMLAVIAWFADRPPAHARAAVAAPLLLPIALLAALWALLPPGWPGRKLAWIAGLASVLLRSPAPPRDCVDIAVLDVGQGLAAVLKTRRRTVVFDTGPAFRSGGDAGRLVLIPYLRARGVTRVDLLVVSHADSDHAGGAASLLAAMPVVQAVAGEFLPAFGRPLLQCRQGQAWLWDGVRFAFMHPGGEPSRNDNDRSCVLEVSVGPHRALLTGDIETAVERRLLREEALSPVALVVVPHHGSRTSSSRAFVDRLQPGVAVVSAGFGNRWDLPAADVVKRWREAGARVDNTAISGAIRYRMCARSGLETVRRDRKAVRRLWREPAGRGPS